MFQSIQPEAPYCRSCKSGNFEFKILRFRSKPQKYCWCNLQLVPTIPTKLDLTLTILQMMIFFIVNVVCCVLFFTNTRFCTQQKQIFLWSFCKSQKIRWCYSIPIPMYSNPVGIIYSFFIPKNLHFLCFVLCEFQANTSCKNGNSKRWSSWIIIFKFE